MQNTCKKATLIFFVIYNGLIVYIDNVIYMMSEK